MTGNTNKDSGWKQSDTNKVPPIPQEPKKGVATILFTRVPELDITHVQDITRQIDALYRPLLEQAERRNETLATNFGEIEDKYTNLKTENARLKEERDNWAKEANQRSAKDIEKINALESQLKPENEKMLTYEIALKLIAGCVSHSEGDVVDIARKALASTEKGGTK